jgi:single-strand DNA-binding protein
MADIKFTGNVGKDAELRWTPNGRAVLNFSVADSKSRKLDNGEWETLAEQWLNCAIWGDEAEFYAEKIKRGARDTDYGDFMSRKYEAKDGAQGTSLDVTVKGVDIMPSRNGGNQQAGGGQRSAGQQQQDDPWAAPTASNSGGWGNGPEQDPPF